jgi:RNA polymerase sigma factor (sigma-70 family)
MEAQSLPHPGRLLLPRSPRALAAFGDDRLVEQVRRGNEAAFEAIYDRHHRAMLSFCRHMLASADEAEDAVQQTFISAYGSLRADARDINLKPWLYAIARNRCLTILRARRERPAEIDDVPTVGLAEEVQQRTDLRELLGDLRGLPDDQRAALVLSELGDLSHAEIGHIVGCEGAKVKSLVFQARSSLIESRNARDIPCHEIREQLATATGGELRRGPLRRHLRSCEGCAEFRDQVRRQRRALAAILPVVPTLGLKNSALAAIGIGGGGGGAAAGGGLASLFGSSAAVKGVALLAVAGFGVGGGLVIESKTVGPNAEAAGGQRDAPAIQAVAARAGGPGAIKLTTHRTALRTGNSGQGAAGTGGGHRGPAQAGGRRHSQGNHGRGGRGNGPGAPGNSGSRHQPAPGAGTIPHTGGNGHGGRGSGSRPHTNNGRHLGWQIGRGHQNHEGDSGGTHVPGGHVQQPAPAPAPAPDPTGDATPRGGGEADSTSRGHGNEGKHRLPALPPVLPELPPGH